MDPVTEQKASRVMSEAYNESCSDWSNVSIATTGRDLIACIQRYHQLNPQRFEDLDSPFVIAEFGCATGASSVLPLKTIIDEVRKIQPAMAVQVYLNDLPENHHSLAISAVSEGLGDYEDVYVMVAGKDFTSQVFPNNSLDIAYSNMTVMILPTAPTARTDNVFFLATPEKLKSEQGREWVSAFTQHWTAFVTQRQKELKRNGQLFVTALIYDDPNLSYQTKESKFFQDIASLCLREVLKKYSIEDKLPSTLKTSVSMFKTHYTDVCDRMPERINVVSAKAYDVVDCFHAEYMKTKDSRVFGQKVTAYIRGWWEHVLEGGLAYEGVDSQIIKQVSKELFDVAMPTFVSERADVYPEYYRVLALSLQKP